MRKIILTIGFILPMIGAQAQRWQKIAASQYQQKK